MHTVKIKSYTQQIGISKNPNLVGCSTQQIGIQLSVSGDGSWVYGATNLLLVDESSPPLNSIFLAFRMLF